MKHLLTALTASAAVALPDMTSATAAEWYRYPVEVWDPPFDMASPRTAFEHQPLEKASEKWDICGSFQPRSVCATSHR